MEEEALGLLPPAMANAMGDAITGAKTYAHPSHRVNDTTVQLRLPVLPVGYPR